MNTFNSIGKQLILMMIGVMTLAQAAHAVELVPIMPIEWESNEQFNKKNNVVSVFLRRPDGLEASALTLNQEDLVHYKEVIYFIDDRQIVVRVSWELRYAIDTDDKPTILSGTTQFRSHAIPGDGEIQLLYKGSPLDAEKMRVEFPRVAIKVPQGGQHHDVALSEQWKSFDTTSYKGFRELATLWNWTAQYDKDKRHWLAQVTLAPLHYTTVNPDSPIRQEVEYPDPNSTNNTSTNNTLIVVAIIGLVGGIIAAVIMRPRKP